MRAVVVGTAGHIDHGKSALVEALTGTHPDRLKEEQARGITIDLGFAHFTHGDADVALVDVPGHERFVKNMLAGAGGIDAVLLVVAADESVMPQTREHFDICRLLGVSHGLVALTKCDLVDADTLQVVGAEVRELVAGSFLDGAPVLPVSARSGEGLARLRNALAAIAGRSPRLERAGLARLPVDRVFSVKGFGAVVTGTLVSGRVAEGDELEALPAGGRVRVRGVQTHGTRVDAASAPRRVALNLGSVEASSLARGVTLATAGSLPVTRRLDVRLDVVGRAAPLAHGSRVSVHHGTSDVAGRVALAAVRAPREDRWAGVPPGHSKVAVQPGGAAFARLRLDRPIVLTRGDRVVLRASSPATTIGGGLVLDPEPPPGRLRRAAALRRFMALDDPAGAWRIWVHESGFEGLSSDDLVRRGGLSPADAAAVVAESSRAGWAIAIDGRLFESEAVEAAESALVGALAVFHAERPREAGCPREDLRHRVTGRASPRLFTAVVDRLAARGVVAGTDRLRLSSHQPDLDETRREAADRILDVLDRGGLAPPDQAALGAALGLSPNELAEVIRALVRRSQVVRLDALVFHRARLEALKQEIRALGAGARVDVAVVKARYGLSRKYAIPLLEWLDRERVTRRTAESRVVL